MVLEVNSENLNEVLKEDISILQFSAPWCGPCKMLSPVIDELSNTNENITIGKVDVDSSQDLAVKYGIRGVPSVLFMKNGEVVDKLVGINAKQTYQEKIDNLK